MSPPAKTSWWFLPLLLAAIASAPGDGHAEIHTLSWNAVTTYTDAAPIEPAKSVTYDIYWTTDASLSTGSLRTVASSVSQTSTPIDTDALGLPAGQTVYFTAIAVLSTGEKSDFASPYSWKVPAGSTLPGLPAPDNLSIAGPVTASTPKQFRLTWDPVTSRADGTPIPAGTVRYDAQWSADPSMAAGQWHSLASSISTTSVDFDPDVAGMPKNQRVYFTVRSNNTLGEQSPPSGAMSWVSNNRGPSSPVNGKIQKK
jgi:hypothetical protein